MPICGEAIVQLADRAVPLGTVVVGDAVRHPVAGTVRDVARRRSQAVTVRTLEGPTITCTGGTLLRSPLGWVRADACTVLTVRGLPARVAVDGDSLTVGDATAVERIRARVVDATPAQLELVLTVERGARAEVQRCLLALGIRSALHRSNGLLLDPRSAVDYVLRVGVDRPAVADHIVMGRDLGEVPVVAGAQASIVLLLDRQGLSDHLGHGAELRELQELSATAMARELITREAARMIALLRVLPVRDFYQRALLLQLLEEQVGESWMVRVRDRVRAQRRDLVDLVGVDAIVDGFVARGPVRASG